MEQKVKTLFENKDYEGIRKALEKNHHLANEGIPYDEVNITKAHPLHRICDAVFSGKITDDEAVEIAKILLEYGANVNGFELIEKRDTPLLAAASLHADKVAILYIENGANIHHAGCHGGTALHWAAWCGRDVVVNRLIKEGAEINKRCIDFKATPLFWAVHGLKNGGEVNMHRQFECIKILVEAGADKNTPNCDGNKPVDLLNGEDLKLRELLS
jgi:ankyrin repeat protein